MSSADPADQAVGRQEALRSILDSDAPKKLIVAGPGTGKSFTFQQVLQELAGPNLAVTFINALAADLGKSLGEMADTYTFHGFCRHLLHATPTAGLHPEVDYYPQLTVLQAEDISHLYEVTTERDIERALHFLDDSEAVISRVIASGNYYNAVGHCDSVYRVLRYFEAQPDQVPNYELVVVDEFQDFSFMESEFIALLAAQNRIRIVGDDDQSLYGFKNASARYIRDLAAGGQYARFELPYCSRCTPVLVDATHRIIARALRLHALAGRLDKRYECYLPDKEADGARYPKIVHADCTVERNNAPYMERYIWQRIQAIPPDETVESYAKGYPTVLVIGPTQFASRVYEDLSTRLKNVVFKKSSQAVPALLDGICRLANDPASHLGWRIILFLDPIDGLPDVLRAALLGGVELVDLLPDQYRQRYLHLADLLGRLLGDDAMTETEIEELENGARMPILEIRTRLGLVEAEPVPEPTSDEGPSVVVTTLVGSKGLQAAHTFIVGLNEGHFPQDNRAVSDDEICSVLVGLTRATKSCTLVSCRRFGNQRLVTSCFVAWLGNTVERVVVDRAFFNP